MKKKIRVIYYVARTSQLTGNRQYLMSFDVVGKHVEVINVETTRDIDKAYKFIDEEHLAEHIAENINKKYDDGNKWEVLNRVE